MFKTEKYFYSVEKLYIKHRELMLCITLKILADQRLAEDAVNETFARLLKNPSVLKRVDESKRRALLVVMCKNIAIDYLRARRYEAPDAEILPEERPDPLSPDPEAIFIENELFGELTDAVAGLPPPERDVIVLKYYHGLKHDEIAGVLGVTRDTVNKRLRKAKDTLRRELENKI